MKSASKILAVALLLFGVITLATANLEYNADGADEYGFPFNFYTKVSGYNIVSRQESTATDFNALALIVDVIFAFLASGLILILINRIKKTNPI